MANLPSAALPARAGAPSADGIPADLHDAARLFLDAARRAAADTGNASDDAPAFAVYALARALGPCTVQPGASRRGASGYVDLYPYGRRHAFAGQSVRALHFEVDGREGMLPLADDAGAADFGPEAALTFADRIAGEALLTVAALAALPGAPVRAAEAETSA